VASSTRPSSSGSAGTKASACSAEYLEFGDLFEGHPLNGVL